MSRAGEKISALGIIATKRILSYQLDTGLAKLGDLLIF
jgi:hypothetical protein